jgi:putative PIG3 family NAD(P)H quinone oxidoreductase
MMALTFVDVLCRKLLDRSIPGSLEVTELLMFGVIFAGLPLTSLRGEHVLFDLLDHLLPAALRAVQGLISNLICTALLAGGGYAQQVAVPAGHVMSVPAGVDLVTAGGLPEVACTVWSNLVMTAHLAEGEWVLIHGGGSGIGTFAIQVARALGARVAVTAGSQAKLDACAALGAEVLIDYNEQDFVEVMKAETGSRGVDVILDNMGAKYLERNVDALARNGRLVVIGLQGGVKAELNIGTMLRKNVSVTATGLRGRPDSEKAAICDAVERNVWPWIAAGIVKPVIDRVMPIDEAGDAHSLIEVGAITGKLVLLVRA